MLLQLRVTVPPERTDAVRSLFEDSPGTAHIAVFPGASIVPRGDVVLADVARESADGLVTALRELDCDRDGGIVLAGIDAAVSRRAENAEKAAPGEGSDAVVWEQVIRATAAEASLSVSYLAFLTVATLLAGIAIILDSPILVIGAMVLGPEFGPLAAFAVALIHRRRSTARRAAVSLVGGFVVAIALTVVAALLGRLLGWIGPELLARPRPNTGFITAPDRWSVVIAVLAGIAGVLSLTAAKGGALVGVFISVTTVPAAGAMALGVALGNATTIGEGAAQLGINLATLTLTALATLALQRAVWRRVPGAVPAMEHVPRPRRP